MSGQSVRIRYVNHRGEEAVREIIPREIRFGSTTWHPVEQWLMEALDVDKARFRTFAMAGIKEWGVADNPPSPEKQGAG
jgi:predicted DNA-binding transcriptional regulator YafY